MSARCGPVALAVLLVLAAVAVRPAGTQAPKHADEVVLLETFTYPDSKGALFSGSGSFPEIDMEGISRFTIAPGVDGWSVGQGEYFKSTGGAWETRGVAASLVFAAVDTSRYKSAYLLFDYSWVIHTPGPGDEDTSEVEVTMTTLGETQTVYSQTLPEGVASFPIPILDALSSERETGATTSFTINLRAANAETITLDNVRLVGRTVKDIHFFDPGLQIRETNSSFVLSTVLGQASPALQPSTCADSCLQNPSCVAFDVVPQANSSMTFFCTLLSSRSNSPYSVPAATIQAYPTHYDLAAECERPAIFFGPPYSGLIFFGFNAAAVSAPSCVNISTSSACPSSAVSCPTGSALNPAPLSCLPGGVWRDVQCTQISCPNLAGTAPPGGGGGTYQGACSGNFGDVCTLTCPFPGIRGSLDNTSQLRCSSLEGWTNPSLRCATCTPNLEYADASANGACRNCALCAPGFGRVSGCNGTLDSTATGTLDSVCAACPPGTFSPTASLDACRPVSSTACPSKSFLSAPATPTSDRVCSPCKRCPPGQGVGAACGPASDTTCVACTANATFSSEDSATELCRPCSSCPRGTFFAGCGPASPSSCQPCPPGTFNPGETTSPTACRAVSPPCAGPGVVELAAPTPSSDRGCGACSLCLPGDGYVGGCNGTTGIDTQCAPCAPNTFSNTTSRDPCQSCAGTCAAGERVVSLCSSTSQLACAPCPPGTFTPTAGLATTCKSAAFGCLANTYTLALPTPTSDRQCRTCTPCAPGSGHVGGCNSTTGMLDAECAPCAPGTFQPALAINAPCAAHTVCGGATPFEAVSPTASSDRLCVACDGQTTFALLPNTTCRATRTCSVGEFEAVAPTPTSDRSCSGCGPGTFQDDASQTTCKPASACGDGRKVADDRKGCTPCLPPAAGTGGLCNITCGSGQRAVPASAPSRCEDCPAGTRGQAGVCVNCADGQFSAAGSPICQDCMACGVGKGVLGGCSGDQDTICGECLVGSLFSAEISHQPCQSCSPCQRGFGVKSRCVAATDTVCELCVGNLLSTTASTTDTCKAGRSVEFRFSDDFSPTVINITAFGEHLRRQAAAALGVHVSHVGRNVSVRAGSIIVDMVLANAAEADTLRDGLENGTFVFLSELNSPLTYLPGSFLGGSSGGGGGGGGSGSGGGGGGGGAGMAVGAGVAVVLLAAVVCAVIWYKKRSEDADVSRKRRRPSMGVPEMARMAENPMISLSKGRTGGSMDEAERARFMANGGYAWTGDDTMRETPADSLDTADAQWWQSSPGAASNGTCAVGTSVDASASSRPPASRYEYEYEYEYETERELNKMLLEQGLGGGLPEYAVFGQSTLGSSAAIYVAPQALRGGASTGSGQTAGGVPLYEQLVDKTGTIQSRGIIYEHPNLVPRRSEALYALPPSEEGALYKSLAEVAPTLELDPGRIDFGGGASAAQPAAQLLGKGAFGEVRLATLDGATQVAVKTLKQGALEKDRVAFMSEAYLMAQFRGHANVLQLVGYVTHSTPVMIVLEYMAGGALIEALRVGRFKGPGQHGRRRAVSLDVARGMSFLAERSFVHRDLAARNVLLSSSGTAKVADFGFSRELVDKDYYSASANKRFPLKWSSLEAILFRKYSEASDAWAFGVTLWEVWADGASPYKGKTAQDIVGMVCAGERLAAPRGCPQSVYALMIKLWHPDPTQRPLFAAIVDAIEAMDGEEGGGPLDVLTKLSQAYLSDPHGMSGAGGDVVASLRLPPRKAHKPGTAAAAAAAGPARASTLPPVLEGSGGKSGGSNSSGVYAEADDTVQPERAATRRVEVERPEEVEGSGGIDLGDDGAEGPVLDGGGYVVG